MRWDLFNLPIKNPLCQDYFWVSIAKQFAKEDAQMSAIHKNSSKSTRNKSEEGILALATKMDF